MEDFNKITKEIGRQVDRAFLKKTMKEMGIDPDDPNLTKEQLERVAQRAKKRQGK